MTAQLYIITQKFVRKESNLLRPDAKSQVTIEYDDNNRPVKVHTIVVSTQHDEFIRADENKSQEEADNEMIAVIRRDVENILIPRIKNLDPQFAELFKDDFILHVNPTGICSEVRMAYRLDRKPAA